MKISVARALGELKMLDKRIAGLTESLSTCDLLIDGKLRSKKTVDEFEATVKSDFASLNSLIERRNKIKKLIVLSNAMTTVKIDGEILMVAEANEKKVTIQCMKDIRDRLATNHANMTRLEKHNNENVQNRLDKLLESTFSKDSSKVKSDEYEAVATPFLKRNQATIVDPLNSLDTIKEIDEKISKFEAEVDICLSESNARTEIEID